MKQSQTQIEDQVALRYALAKSVNVLSLVHANVYFPTFSNGLKDIGTFLGCRWSAPDAWGIQSIVWRRRWEQTRNVALKDKLTLNAEDCLALKELQEQLYSGLSERCNKPTECLTSRRRVDMMLLK